MEMGGNVARLAAAQKEKARLETGGHRPGGAWPKLREAAFHGLAGRFVRKLEPHTEADPAGILVQFLVMFGSLVGRGPYFRVEADEHFPNLFTVLVGESSVGRKGVSLGQAKRLLAAVDGDWARDRFTTGLSSGEGLIHAVRDPVEKLVPDEEGNQVRTLVDDGVEDKRLMVVETEFVSVFRNLKREGNILSPILRSAWDSGSLRTLTKISPSKATGAHISIIGHITTSELLKRLDSTEAANGFGNRFLWCCVRRSKELPDGGEADSLDFSGEVEDLAQCAALGKAGGAIQRSSEANQLWREVYADLTKSRSGIFGSMVSRAAPQVMRLACIYAMLDRQMAIGRQHLDAALAIWAYCEDSARWIFGEAVGDPVADEILRQLHENPAGLTRTEIGNALGRHQPREALDSALAQLRQQGLAASVRQGTKGRPVEKWRASEGAHGAN
jgi:hypothetical protein